MARLLPGAFGSRIAVVAEGLQVGGALGILLVWLLLGPHQVHLVLAPLRGPR